MARVQKSWCIGKIRINGGAQCAPDHIKIKNSDTVGKCQRFEIPRIGNCCAGIEVALAGIA
jgi:hypothetical protein